VAEVPDARTQTGQADPRCLPSARWRPWAALIVATSAGLLTVALTPAPAVYRHPSSPFDLHGFAGAQLLAYRIAFPVVLLAVVAGGLSLLVRFHRAVGTERLQLRWVSLSAGLVALVLAVAFRPARRRVQNLVDRHFNRRRYDAAQTIQAFAARLRHQPDLDLLASDLLAVVDQTMEPTSAALWLAPRPPSGA
jgi:hypothetical protein